MSEPGDRIDTPCPAYRRMATRWELIHDLLGGTLAMRDAGTKWLPQEPGEEHAAYQRRRDRSILYDGFADTVEKLASRPFSKPISLADVPPKLEYIEADVDRQGRSLTRLGRDLLADMATYGLCHVLVDFTRLEVNESGVRRATIAEEAAAGARAVLLRVTPPSLIGWTPTLDAKGVPSLAQIRILETVEEPDGAYGAREVEQIRVIDPAAWGVWRKTGQDDAWIQVDGGPHTAGEVYLVTAYASQTGFLEARPPLEGLAWLNLAHWQSDSDQRNILRVSRFPIITASGLSQEETEREEIISPNRMLKSANKDAQFAYLEHNGAAIEAGRKDLEDLERRMEARGHQVLTKQATSATATERMIDESGRMTIMQSWIRSLEGCLRDCYARAARWHAVELPESFTLDVFSDFRVSSGGSVDMPVLLQAAAGGMLSRETLLGEMKRRGLLAEDVDPAEEAERAAQDDAGLGLPDMNTEGAGGEE